MIAAYIAVGCIGALFGCWFGFWAGLWNARQMLAEELEEHLGATKDAAIHGISFTRISYEDVYKPQSYDTKGQP